MALKVAHVTTVDLTLRFLLFDQLRRLRDEGYEVTAISAPGPWVDDLEDEGIRHIEWPGATRAWDPASDLKAARSLYRILKEERFDIVHTHNPKPGVIGRAMARLARVPIVVNTVHGLYATPEDGVLKKAVVLGAEAVASRFSDLELFQSEEDLLWARRLRVVPRHRSVLLGNGTDISRFDPEKVSAHRIETVRKQLGIDERALVVGTVGRLVVEKGYLEFFQAARAVREKMPEAVFLAVGEVDLQKKDSVPQSAIEGASEDVIFAGWRRDVPELLAVMDVFVLPSWREGVPRSVIEAAAMGKPLIVTDIRGCREIVRRGVEGLIVSPRDSTALTTALLDVLGDGALRERMGNAARERAVESYDEQRVMARLVGAYRALARKEGLRPAGGGEPEIRPARRQDAPALARLHAEGMPDAFLPHLGPRFMKVLYETLSEEGDAVVLVADDGAGVVGFAAGVVSVPSFYKRFLKRKGARAALAAAPRLMRPSVARRSWETARYPNGAGDYPSAELLSIAVDGEVRSGGLGRRLASGVIDGLAAKGAGRVKVIVGAENQGANRFYDSVGFHAAGTISVHRGEDSNVWVIACSS